jgi:hypothetical protein
MPQKKDPTVTSASTGDAYPEGTHPAVSVSEGADSADEKKYAENPDKPDPTSIAQVEVTDK